MNYDWVTKTYCERPLTSDEIRRNAQGSRIVERRLDARVTEAIDGCVTERCGLSGRIRLAGKDGEPWPFVQIKMQRGGVHAPGAPAGCRAFRQ